MHWFETEEMVRFNEVDEWGIAWYGHYLAWFEVARIRLLRQFDLLPKDMVELGYIAPIIKVSCEYKRPVTSGDYITILAIADKPEIAADSRAAGKDCHLPRRRRLRRPLSRLES